MNEPKQKTDEWLKQREGKITGSTAAAALGISPFMTKQDLMLTLLGHKKFEGNVATQYGEFHEELAIQDFEMELTCKVEEVGFLQHPDIEWLGASPDGLVGDDAVLEIKCPYNLRDDENPEFKSIDEQDHYYCQVQLEMLCAGRNKCYFFQWNRYAHVLEIVNFDPMWLEENLPLLAEFYSEFVRRKNQTNKDLADAYIAAKLAFDEAKSALDDAKQDLLDLKQDTVENIKITKSKAKGAIDYSKVPELKGVDLEPYRKKSYEKVSITVVK